MFLKAWILGADQKEIMDFELMFDDNFILTFVSAKVRIKIIIMLN